MKDIVYKPGKEDIFVGILVSFIASLTFLPLTAMIAVLVKNLAGTGQSTATGILILQSALISIFMFRSLWNDAVYVREIDDEEDSDGGTGVEEEENEE